MNRRFTRIAMPLLLAAVGLPASGADPIFEFDFTEQTGLTKNFTVADNNNDGTKWEWRSYNVSSRPYYYAGVYNWQAESHNDMMTTIKTYPLEAGHAYKMSYQAWSDDSSRTGSTLAIGYFSETGEPGEITPISSITPKFINKYTGTEPDSYEYLFEVPETGKYGFVFMVIGDSKNPGGACIDNIILADAGSPMTPAAPVAVEVSGDENFGLAANVSVVLPSKTVTGSALPSDGITKLEIYRGEVLVHTATQNLVPGATYTWKDNSASAGVNIYSVKVYNGDLVSETTEGSAFVGPMTPKAPTSAAAAKAEGGKIEISWMAPEKSLEDQTLNPTLITYKLWRIVDGEATLLSDALTVTTYTDTYTSESIVKVKYRIEAQYSGRTSESVETGELSFGAYPLPYEESFSEGILPAGWEVTSSGTGYYAKQWEVKSRMTSSPSAETFDSDGGMLTFNSYSASRDIWSQAITPEINIKGLPTPVVEFQFYHSTQNGSDKIVLEISKDGSEFEIIPDSEITRYVYGKNGWTNYQFPLAAYNDADAVRISFKAISGYGYDMAIDAVKVYSAKAYDLEATAINGVASVNAGEDAEFKLTVSNVAFAEVGADDYEVDVYVNGNLYDTLAGQTLAPGASAEFEFAVPTHAGHEDTGITVYADVRFDADEDTSNNISQEINTGVSTYSGAGVAEIQGEVDGDVLRLSWEAIVPEDYEPMTAELTLDGEDYYISPEDYKANKTIAIKSVYTDGEGREWKSIDADGKVSDAVFSLPGNAKAFMYTSAEMTGNNAHQDYSGEKPNGMLIAVAPKEGKASDYIVAPVTPGSGDHILEFMAKSYGICLADFEVVYSTEEEFTAENIEEKFVSFGQQVNIPYNNNRESGKWKEYSYHLPREAKYIGIHFFSENGSHWEYDYDTYESELVIENGILCLDNIKLTSTPMDAPTYNVYYREYEETEAELRVARAGAPVGTLDRHNDEALSEAVYEVELPGVTTDFHVSTVYPKGETSLSDAYHYNVATGVVEVAETGKTLVRVEGNVISMTSAGANIAFDVYSLDGEKLAAGVAKYTATAGIYLIKAGNVSAKVIVR